MPIYYSKEDRELIERLNKILGMSHRSKPYDFSDANQLAEAFAMTISEYIDYQNYYMTIDTILGKFDESLEYFDPVTWMSLNTQGVKGDKLALRVIDSLTESENHLSKIYSRAEKKCEEMLVLILNLSPSVKKAVLGKDYLYDKEAISHIFEDCVNVSDTYSIDESKEAFMKILDSHLPVNI